nr:MAG TPA: Lower collar protein [Caudoviricetes sp.]
MSKYTTELRFICESSLQNNGIDIKGLSVDEIIKKSLPYVFNFSFPIYDNDYLPILEHNIINNFYTREIGFETVQLWKQKLNSRLNLIMPKYNKIYESELYKLDPLSNNSEIENFTRETKGNSQSDAQTTTTRTGTGTTYSTTQNIYSDTPQGTLSGRDYATSLNEDKTNGNTETSETGNGQSTETQNVNNAENYIRKRSGLTGTTISNSINDFIINFKSIDNMIIEELEDLFMLIW